MQSLIIVTTSKKKKKVHSIEFQKRFIEYKQFNSGKRETEGIFTLSSHPLTELISDELHMNIFKIHKTVVFTFQWLWVKQ